MTNSVFNISWRSKIGYGDFITGLGYAHSATIKYQRPVHITFHWPNREDELPSVSYEEVGHIIDLIISLPTHLEIPRLFLQHSCNYQLVQQMKASRYKD